LALPTQDPTTAFTYLDYAGACPLLPEIAEGHADLCRRYIANPHATSRFSELAKRALHGAEQDLLAALDIAGEEARVVWTSGGTEADNLATLGVLRRTRGALALVDAGAHPALAEPCRQYARREQGRYAEVPLRADGALDLARVEPDLAREAVLVALTHVNNETGAIADLPAARSWMRTHAPKAVLSVDAAQSFGKHAIPWREAAIDMLVVSARKIGGPAGMAALVLRRGVRLEPVLYGGGQQDALRSGTVDVVGAIETARTTSLVCAGRAAEFPRVAALNQFLRDRLGTWTRPAVPLLSPIGASPWILTFALPGYEGAVLMRMLAEHDVLVATGSACSAESGKTSHVLRAMGIPDGLARCVLRVSVGRHTTQEHLERLLRELRAAVDRY